MSDLFNHAPAGQPFAAAAYEQPKQAGPRSLRAIAREIRQTWPKVNYAAVPYLDAMGSLDSISDSYGCDGAKSIVLYFLSNVATWRGPDAKRIKAELKGMLK